MIQSATFVISAWRHVVDFVVIPFPSTDPVAALQAAIQGERQESGLTVPLVSTGVYAGPIDLTVEVLDARPDATSPEWEDIHELSLMIPEGQVYFDRPESFERKDVGAIVGDEKGSYRARLHASGRDAAYDGVVESPAERHLVQFWKEPPSPVSVLSSRSQVGKSLPRFVQMWQTDSIELRPIEPRPIPRESQTARTHRTVSE